MKYVLDTNVVLGDPNAVLAFDGAEVILPFTVLEELDSIKSRKVDISRDARVAIRNISSILEGATHEEIATDGVPISRTHPLMKSTSTLRVLTIEELTAIYNISGNEEVLLQLNSLFESTVPDDKIILVAKLAQAVLVTRDINMRIKALAYGVEVQDYRHDITIEDSDLIHTGHYYIEGSIWDSIGTVYSEQFGSKLFHYIPKDMVTFLPDNVCEGDYLYDDTDVLFVYDGIGVREEQDEEGKVTSEEEYYIFIDIGQQTALKRKVWDIKAKNIQQAMAINSIMDEDVHITVLLGAAGTGKTLITIASSLELVLEKRKYDRIIFSKTQDSQFEEIGFLPGSELEKVIPFCGAAVDSLEYLHKDDANPQGSIEEIMKRNVFQFKALNFIRGRSFINTILIVDEFQNITPAQAKTILTRAGENCKVVILGNLSQIDNKFISPTNSGLTYVTEKFKDWNGCRIIELEGVQRSPLAEYAEEHL